MAILRGIYPKYICDFEAEKISLIAGNPNGTQITVRASELKIINEKLTINNYNNYGTN